MYSESTDCFFFLFFSFKSQGELGGTASQQNTSGGLDSPNLILGYIPLQLCVCLVPPDIPTGSDWTHASTVRHSHLVSAQVAPHAGDLEGSPLHAVLPDLLAFAIGS